MRQPSPPLFTLPRYFDWLKSTADISEVYARSISLESLGCHWIPFTNLFKDNVSFLINLKNWLIDPETEPDQFVMVLVDRQGLWCAVAVVSVNRDGGADIEDPDPAEMDAIMDLAARHRLSVIENAAPSIGAEFRGQRTGTFGEK